MELTVKKKEKLVVGHETIRFQLRVNRNLRNNTFLLMPLIKKSVLCLYLAILRRYNRLQRTQQRE
jgi:hypothetical protein